MTNILTICHYDLMKTVTSNVYTSDLINILTKFHEDWMKTVTSIVYTRKTAPPPWCGHFHDDWAKNVLSSETNVLTKFHENWAKNVTSRVFTCFRYIHIEKNAPPTDINKTNVLSNFHDDSAKSVTSIVFTRKTARPTGGHVFQRTGTSFELNQRIVKKNILTNFELDRDIIGTKLLTKFHEDRKRNMPSRTVHKSSPEQSGKLPCLPGNHVFQRTRTNFEPNSRILETKVLTKFQEDWSKNVTSRVFTCFHNIHIEKNALPTGGHVFPPIWTIFILVRDINKINVLTNFHDDWDLEKTAPPTGGHVFQRTGTTFELNKRIIKKNILTNDLFRTRSSFIGTRLLTKIHEDRKINVASSVYEQMWTEGQTTDKDRTQKLT
ncbi:hypothetical protein DPMN_106058 [Dreissena polymorpha]|uniref:Uncharacterized protein n=1 Tax=Dreissena polymorpha TaxID=45954 RepID=A0A9D4K4A7_DREPO|nr:hypothetical protein DPMN_106058 [Dreissena polymorpha]